MYMKNIIIAIVVCTVLGVGGWYILSAMGDTGKTSTELAEKQDVHPTETTMSKPVTESSQYIDYSVTAFADAKNKKRVLFFHASWCPTCKVANEAFLNQMQEIPEDVVVFKTDYDTNDDLKKKYGITYQHTFVQVDENENALVKWNGGDIDALKTNIN
jgi:thioredoxin 1